jgi:hypothetical protein
MKWIVEVFHGGIDGQWYECGKFPDLYEAERFVRGDGSIRGLSMRIVHQNALRYM